MTLQNFRDIILTADPGAVHYKKLGGGVNYTSWHEWGKGDLYADGREAETKLLAQVDRFTKAEYDPVVDAISAALDRDDVAASYQADFEADTGYIHHIWTVEAV